MNIAGTKLIKSIKKSSFRWKNTVSCCRMNVLHYLLISLIHITGAQFPNHLDLQKVGEIIFNNEKYNILKPAVHKVTDHFKDFMLRRENKNKNERVFMDDNGFRHFWSGHGKKEQSLRKTEIKLYEVNNNDPKNPEAEVNKDVDKKNDAVKDTTKALKKRPKRPKTSLEEEEEEKMKEVVLRVDAKKPESGGAGKKVAITSFFCPFFGVMTMTSFLD